MLNAIIRISLTHRGIILVASLVVLVYGGYLTTTIPIDVFPDLDRPRVVLLTECPGLSPEEVETLVTQPMEASLLGATGVEAVRSQSILELSIIYVEFGWKTEVRHARQVVSERLATATLPNGIRPQMLPPASLMGQILHVGLSWGGEASADPTVDIKHRMELRSLADWVIRPRLLKLHGIAEVIILGGNKKQYQILVDPDKLQEYNISLQDVEAAIQATNLNASGGFIEEGQTERPVRVIGRLGPVPQAVINDLLQVPIKSTTERPVLLGNVASIEEGPAPKRGDASVNGQQGIVITIVKQPHADTRLLTDQAKLALADLRSSLPANVVINTNLFQLKSFIDRGIYYVEEALAIGAGLVVIVLFLFLMNLRTTLITLTAIPLSLVMTTLAFRLIGRVTGSELSINVMTLGGIAVAMGELVDDAIVDVENIFRRLRENHAAATPLHPLVVVYRASKEIRSAIVFGTAVVILSFVPLFALSGVEGRLFTPLGIAYIVSILASLLVSLTVTPVLSYYLLPQSRAAHGNKDSMLLRTLKQGASYLIRFSLTYAGELLLLTWALVVVCAYLLTQLGSDFLPKFDEGSVQINVILPGNSSLKASNESVALIDAKLKTLQKSVSNPNGLILNFARRTGRAELDEHVEPVSNTEYIVTMNQEVPYQRDVFLRTLLGELRTEVPGVDISAEQPMGHMISHLLSGVSAQIAIKIFGDDVDKLREIAGQIRDTVAKVEGITPPIIDPQERVDELHIVLRPSDLAYFGLSRQYVADFVQTAMKGETVSQVLEGQRRYNLIVKLKEPFRSDAYRLKELRLNLPNGQGQIRLGEVADFPESASGPNQVNRENARRKQVVRCNVSGRDLGSTVNEVERLVREKIKLPEGYYIEFGGQFEAQRSATLLISILAGVSFVGILLVLLMLYPSLRISLQILNAIPTAFIGGVLALVLTKQTLTVASLVGFVSLAGIAVRNGILLVTHYFHLMKEEGEGYSKQMILRGSLERLAPVLMTALTAGIALIPLVIGGKKPGLEILYPVATVILGGLVTSTFCEFLLHPGLFWKFSGKDAQRLVHRTSEEALLEEPAGLTCRSD
ncbi:MAG TPA: efflux RND transporter permease subunit [Gemmatales bacterium]|nr:efflux RND transporter permease subunit [Gemmatales bacterium]